MTTIYRFEHAGGDTAYFQVAHQNGAKRECFGTTAVQIRTSAEGVDYVYFDEPEDCEEIAVAYDLEDEADTWASCDDDNNCIPLSALLPFLGKEVRS